MFNGGGEHVPALWGNSPGLFEGVEIRNGVHEPADRHNRAVNRRRRDHRVEPGTVIKTCVDRRGSPVDTKSERRYQTSHHRNDILVVAERDISSLEVPTALDPHLVVPVHENVGHSDVMGEMLERSETDDRIDSPCNCARACQRSDLSDDLFASPLEMVSLHVVRCVDDPLDEPVDVGHANSHTCSRDPIHLSRRVGIRPESNDRTVACLGAGNTAAPGSGSPPKWVRWYTEGRSMCIVNGSGSTGMSGTAASGGICVGEHLNTRFGHRSASAAITSLASLAAIPPLPITATPL